MVVCANIINSQTDENAINNFRAYLRIPTVHPDIDYDECIEFLKSQAKSLGLPYKIYTSAPKKPIFVMTWPGIEPDLPSIWLNSHMDVVPVYEDKWTHKPFDAHMDEEDNIYARGAQDMKSVGIQYVEAVNRLKQRGVTLRRTIHIAFVPDEEVGGVHGGLRHFAATEGFKKLNVGFALDEGVPSANDDFALFYAEKIGWKLKIHCPGQQGHGALLLAHPPGDKIEVVIRKFNEFRAEQVKKYAKEPTTVTLGNLISINLTMLEGGVQGNVVPPEFTATYDVRLPPSVDLVRFESDLNEWCKEAGEGVWIEYLSKGTPVPAVELDKSHAFWTAFKRGTDEMAIKVTPAVLSGCTDARFIRKLGIPAIGFSPINNTIVRAHDNDEYLNAKVFLKGIDIYTRIIHAIGNVN